MLRPEQISRAADRQIAHRDFEAGTELGEFLDRLQTFLRHFVQHFVPLIGKVGVSDPVGTADPAAQLVQLGQPHLVGIMHDQRVDVRDIDAGLDDRRADQHIVLAHQEIENRFLQLLLRHLSVGRRPPGHRARGPKFAPPSDGSLAPGCRGNTPDRRAPAPARSLPGPAIAVLDHIGLHRKTVFRRRFDDGQIPHAQHRHVQRARDRRRRQGQHVHIRLQPFQFLLVGYAEPLLLVHDEQVPDP